MGGVQDPTSSVGDSTAPTTGVYVLSWTVHILLGITSRQQRELRIASRMTREQWGDVESTATKVTKCRLEWLMPDYCAPKQALAASSPTPWRATKDMKEVEKCHQTGPEGRRGREGSGTRQITRG